jgi:hypothetical protein
MWGLKLILILLICLFIAPHNKILMKTLQGIKILCIFVPDFLTYRSKTQFCPLLCFCD